MSGEKIDVLLYIYFSVYYCNSFAVWLIMMLILHMHRVKSESKIQPFQKYRLIKKDHNSYNAKLK